ncbi:MAG: AAA family ATPase [Thermoleophilia bacterium]
MTQPAELRETHISVVTMIGDRAYKLMKPVATGFLDHRQRRDRLAACAREVEVNRRFAPDVYLGVLDIVSEDGVPVDHLIEMRRMPASRALAGLLDAPAAEGRVAEVARLVAAFHRDSPSSPTIDRAGMPWTLRALWDEGLDALERIGGDIISERDVERVRDLVHDYITGRRALFESRIADGWIRDGHGDLLTADIYMLDDGPRILDCLAFDDRLRHGDVLLDAAFLAMDLETRGHPQLAALLLDEWSRELGERHPRSLRDHYVAYRAHVRAKIAAIRAVQGDLQASAEARRLHTFALTRLMESRVRLILVGGLPGTGKSTLAEGLGVSEGATVLRSDVLRKELAGVATTGEAGSPFEQGLYRPETTAKVYEELLHRAGPLLSRGETVVVDASWTSAARRRAARDLARARRATVVELHCVLPAEVAASRMQKRRRHGGDASDATPEIARLMQARSDAWPEANPIDTIAGPDDVLAEARRMVRER